MNNIPFLSLKDVTALHGAEINEAVNRVVNGGWYLQGKENEQFEKTIPSLLDVSILLVVLMVLMRLFGFFVHTSKWES